MKSWKAIMAAGVLLPLGLFFLPLWYITLEAPQYPEPLGMDIWINKITDANPHDIKNINLMNHYVGMKEIPEHMAEFDVFPWVISGMAVLGLLLAIFGKYKVTLLWFVIMSVLGIIGMYDFYQWEKDYGNSLSPQAAIKFTDENGEIMGYQPPLFGTKIILNFTAHSYPAPGAYLLGAGMFLTVVAFAVGRKDAIQQSNS